jgi:hypothetical protein
VQLKLSSELYEYKIFSHRVEFNDCFITVQPVPAPSSTKEEVNKRINEGGNNQNEMLFKRGNQKKKQFLASTDYVFIQYACNISLTEG